MRFPGLLSLSLTLFTASALPAQTTTVFGHSCRIGAAQCHDMNTSYSTDTTVPPTGGWVYLRVTAPAGGLTVSGFSLLLRSRNVPNVRVPTRLLAANGSVPGAILREGKPIYVDSTQRWGTTWFANTNFAAGTVFYIGYYNPASEVSLGGTAEAAGTTVSWFSHRDGGSMSGRQTAKWKFRIVCGGGSPNPHVQSDPRIGGTFTWSVDNVPGNGGATPFYGFGNATGWFGGSARALPFDLTGFGAPQCDVLVDPAALGTGYPWIGNSWQTSVSVPADPCLSGFRLFGQWYVLAPGNNAANSAFSNGLEIVIG